MIRPVVVAVEAVYNGENDATANVKNAAYPNTALLFARWVASKEGQKAYAVVGRQVAYSKNGDLHPLAYLFGVRDFALAVVDSKSSLRRDSIA
jgi:ABC-type Fe3+ transport system substrate-binding protein